MRDRTEQRRAEEALRESERRLRATQDHAGVGIHEVDADGHYTRMNETFTRMSGYTIEDFAGRAFWDFVEDEEERRAARDAFARLVRGEIDSHTEQRAYTGKHGRRWWAEVTTTAIRDGSDVRRPDGHFLYAVRVVHDITERRRVEERLREVEARQSFLLRLCDALRPLRDAAEVQAEACRLLGQHLRVAQVGFGEVDDRQEHVTVHRDWNDGRISSVVGTWRMDDFGPAFVAGMKRGGTIVIPDITRDLRTSAPEVAAAYAGIGARAILDVPLVKDGRMVAMLFVHHPEPRPWSTAEVEVVEETCGRLWDAVERARAEAALRASEARFRLMADAVPQIVWITDAEGQVEFFNRQWSNCTGIPYEPTTAAEVAASFVHPEDAAVTMAAFAEARRTGGAFRVEHRIRSVAGEWRWFLVRAEPHRDPTTGEIVRWFGASVDIHERKRIEEALRESEGSRRAALAAARFGTWEWNTATHAVVLDERARAIFGFAPHEGTREEEVFGRIHDEDRPRVWAESRAAAAARGRLETEYRVPLPDGAVRAVASFGDALPGGGDTRMVGVFADITERKRAEEALRGSEARFRALAQASSEVLYRMSPDWSEMRQLTGGGFIADTSNPTRGWMEDYIHPDDQSRVRAAIREAIRTGGVFEMEHRVRRPDGSLGWTVSRAVPILGADGEIVEWFGAASDVTASHEAEERLRESEARWRGLFERMHEGFALCEIVRGPDGKAVDYRYLEVNAAVERLSGIPRPAIVGRLASEAIPGIEAFWTETYARVVETGEPAHFEHRVASLGQWFEVMAFRTEPGRFAALFLNTTERKAAEEKRALLLREIDHRAKNALAVVQSVIRLTNAEDIPSFIKTVEGRVAALARAHTLLASQQWEGSHLHDLMHGELAPFIAGRATFDGPPVRLSAVASQPLAMAVHELATNAAKHGALSVETGTVAVAWWIEGRNLHIRWVERGGPPIDAVPKRSGFGSRVLDGTIRKQLHGTVERTWRPSGLVCDVVVPLGQGQVDRGTAEEA